MRKAPKLMLQGVSLIAILAAAFYLASFARESEAVRDLVSRFGYVGLFAVSLLSGFNLVVPIPAVAFLPLFLESGLSLWPSIFLIVLCVTIADTLSYALGHYGRAVLLQDPKDRMVDKLTRLRERFHIAPMAALFVFAALFPLPNEILVVPLAFMGYRLKHIFPVVLAGNLAFNLLYALGVVNFFGLF